MSSNVTLKQIAAELGLSAMTVSRAINNKSNVDDDTRALVLNKAKSMGYLPNRIAKSLVYSKTYTIGVVLPEISHSFFPEVVRGIEEIAYKKNYQLFLTNSVEDQVREKNAINTLRSHRVDGLLISCSQSSEDIRYFKKLVDTGLPVVFFDRVIEGIGASCVVIDDEESSRKITNHLIRLGYQKIAHLHGPENSSIGMKRLKGFRAAMNENDLNIRNEWLVKSGFNEEGGYKAMKELLIRSEKSWPEAVVAVNDPSAYGAMRAIREAGLSIPADIAITGFSDDVMARYVEPPLTTIFQGGYEIGHCAAKKLIDTIESDEEAETILVDTKLVVRESCGAVQ